MQNLDSLSLLYFYYENYDFINGAIVQKIQLPTRHEIILTIRNLNHDKQINKKLYININPKYPHICFLDETSAKKRNIKIPAMPPMFCMQLRKYLSGSKIQDFKIIKYERILELYFNYFDEVGSLTRLCLALEFMGKHSNIILYNASNKIILGSIHNISADKSSIREIYGGINYTYPPIKNKLDVLNISYATFSQSINDDFYYFSRPLIEKIKRENDNVFEFMQNLQSLNNKEFMCSFWSNNKKTISEAIDEYFSNIMFEEILSAQKTKLKKYLSKDIKKLSKTLLNKVDDTKALKYKQNADLIMSFLYSIKPHQKELIVDDIKIELDENLSASNNAQKYYSLYKKALQTVKISKQRAQIAKEKLDYFETILFNIDSADSFNELDEIKDELIDLGFIQEKKEKIKINANKINFKGFDIYIGKNNKQNDYLISKVADGEDLWFHGLNFPSAHIILKVPNNKKPPTREVLEYCAKLTKENSKAKLSGKTSIIFTKRKNLKKPPNTYLGYVTYKNETEVVI